MDKLYYDVDKYVDYVKKYLMNNYSLSEEAAIHLIEKSNLVGMLFENFDLTAHDSPASWADEIFHAYSAQYV